MIPSSTFGVVVDALLSSAARRATKYLSPDLVVNATHQRKPRVKDRSTTVLLTFGKPNYSQRNFIRTAKRAKEPFPVKRVILTPWPKKRKLEL